MIRPQKLFLREQWIPLKKHLLILKKVLQEHLDNKRDITLFAIAVVGGRLKVVEGLPK